MLYIDNFVRKLTIVVPKSYEKQLKIKFILFFRHLLQCDTTHDLIEWMTKLNRILSALREWNVIGTVPQPRESDL